MLVTIPSAVQVVSTLSGYLDDQLRSEVALVKSITDEANKKMDALAQSQRKMLSLQSHIGYTNSGCSTPIAFAPNAMQLSLAGSVASRFPSAGVSDLPHTYPPRREPAVLESSESSSRQEDSETEHLLAHTPAARNVPRRGVNRGGLGIALAED